MLTRKTTHNFVHLDFVHLDFVHLNFVHLDFVHLDLVHLDFVHLDQSGLSIFRTVVGSGSAVQSAVTGGRR